MLVRKTTLLAFSILLGVSSVCGQNAYVPLDAILDSLTETGGRERHFAKAYFWATHSVNQYIESLPESDRPLMLRMEHEFARYFFEGMDDFNKGVENPVWDPYYRWADLDETQCLLIGINAHINGDIWQTMYHHFREEELLTLAPIYQKGHSAFREVVDSVRAEILPANRKLRFLHYAVLGLDKPIANYMLKKWRNRQLRIALELYKNPEKGKKLLNRSNRKMVKMNRTIRRML